jgi:2-polyprenyl-6-methoxyphenol hydroxylase-like FAD-dependent oxidoreductase
MSTKTISIAVIGGGIGGLAAALQLLREGFDVHVYEQVPVKREVGAGLVLTPNATRLLYHLGLAERLLALAVAPVAWRQRRWQDGKTLMFTPVRASGGAPTFFTVHRADLLSMIAEALPAERVHAGGQLTGLADRGDTVELEFANGERAQADVVIGADGIHSTVRGILLGPEKPRYTGCVAYRGLVQTERLSALDLPIESQLWLGPGAHFVHYPVHAGKLLNFACLVDREAWTKESWTEPGDPADVRAFFAGWHPQVRAILSALDETFVWGLFDRAPLPRWSVNRVTLLGDACHPMLPFMAQGAAQAIEDAATLAAVLARSDDIVEGLRRYEALRLPRTAAIQSTAAGNKIRNHLPDGPEQQARDASMAAGTASWVIGASLWVYQHDAFAAAETGALGLPADVG